MIPPATPTPSSLDLIHILNELQDAETTGLVKQHEGIADTGTTTYINAMAAIAFTIDGEFDRARKVFNFFESHSDPNPDVSRICAGGYPQFWDAATGIPIQGYKIKDASGNVDEEQKNDVWVGDNAWLLLALEDYEQATKDNQFDGLMQQLTGWFICLQGKSIPPPGIYAGFQFDGEYITYDSKTAGKHAEGSIDVYGALRAMEKENPGVGPVRSSIKQWLDINVWKPDGGGGCFTQGEDNKNMLPLDHVSWGFLALFPENNQYKCILSYAERLLTRTQNRYLIEAFDQYPQVGTNPKDWNWQIPEYGGCPPPTISWIPLTEASIPGITIPYAHEMGVAYSCPPKINGADSSFFQVLRYKNIDLKMTDQFQYSFWLKGDGSNNRFEVILINNTGGFYENVFPLDFSGWRKITIAHDGFGYGWGDAGKDLAEIRGIGFAIRNDNPTAIQGKFSIGPIWYDDNGAPLLCPINGFASFSSDGNSLWIQGTAQMADAYFIAGQKDKWKKYIYEMNKLLITPGETGLPNYLYAGINFPALEAEAVAWYIVASHGYNPFAP
jgi:hypothetical protein